MKCQDAAVLYGGTLTTPDLLEVVVGAEGAESVREFWGEKPLHRLSYQGAALAKLKGMTSKRAALLVAAIRLGRREVLEAPEIVRSPEAVYRLLQDMRDLQQEEMRVVLLNTRCQVMDVITVARGGAATCHVEMPGIFRAALVAGATSIILAHNHPSGDPSPSAEDFRVTKSAVDAGRLLGIKVVDHLVIAANGWQRAMEDS